MRFSFCGWLGRLRKDIAGNTLAIAAAALLPLLGMVGGAVDISRYYMANTRLQQACDAGALAARRSMTDNIFSEANLNHGLSFFDHNYSQGTFGIVDLQRSFSASSNGTVTGAAAGELPTTIMQIFGFDTLSLDVSCSAEVNISNTDIVMVLDVTGSMNCPEGGGPCPGGNNNNVEHPNSLIRGLRQAVMSFYDVVDASTSDAAQVRFGIVPYSSGVNVGFSIPEQFMATSVTYQTRVPQTQIVTTTELISFATTSVFNRGSNEFWYTWRNPTGTPGANTSTQCNTAASTSGLGYSDSYIEGSLDPSTMVVESETRAGDIRTRTITARGRFARGVPVARFSTSTSPRCFVDVNHSRYFANFRATVVERLTEREEFTRWRYAPHTWDVSDLVSEGSVTLPTGPNGTQQTHTWDGCIEEANTVRASVFNPLPAGAFDLDINLVPSSPAHFWKPTLGNAVYQRQSSGTSTLSAVLTPNNLPLALYFCPKSAFRLREISRSELESYVSPANGFRALGATYHDIGMIWGGRFISPNGMFAADNATAPNGDAISRHIVYMTDGLLAPHNLVYSPYGVQWWDRRVVDSTSDSVILSRHAARFQAACRQVRAENVSVWVVAFNVELTQSLIDCATPGRVFTADNNAQLEQAFRQIAQRIAALRLTQ